MRYWRVVPHPQGSALLTLEAAPSGQLRAIAGDRAPIGAVARFLPQNPLAELRLASGQPSVPPSTVLKAPSDPGAWSDCLVDFSDHDALALLPDAAKTTFAISPWWFQACNGVSHAVVRPIGEDHFHLGYENPHISVCEVSPNVFDYGVLADDGTCTAIDPSQEARSLYPHLGKRTTHLYVWDGLRKQPFRLNSVRVEGGVAFGCAISRCRSQPVLGKLLIQTARQSREFGSAGAPYRQAIGICRHGPAS